MVSTRVLASTCWLIEVFDVLLLFVGQRAEVREVEAQAVIVHQRSSLLHVRAEHLAQRCMQQVSAGVIAARGVAICGIDHGVDLIADSDRLADDGAVREHSLHRLESAGHFRDDAVVVGGIEPAGVADLTAGVGVEAGLVEHDFHLLVGMARRAHRRRLSRWRVLPRRAR